MLCSVNVGCSEIVGNEEPSLILTRAYILCIRVETPLKCPIFNSYHFLLIK